MLSFGSLRYNLRLIGRFLPAGKAMSVIGTMVGPVVDPGLVVVGSVVKLPWPAVPVPWLGDPVSWPGVPVPVPVPWPPDPVV